MRRRCKIGASPSSDKEDKEMKEEEGKKKKKTFNAHCNETIPGKAANKETDGKIMRASSFSSLSSPSSSLAAPAITPSSEPPATRPQEPSVETSYVTAKWYMLRLLGVVHLCVFVAAWHQNIGLMGHHGLLPVQATWQQFTTAAAAAAAVSVVNSNDHDSLWQHQFCQHPTLFWWIAPSDDNLQFMSLAGILAASLALVVDSWLLWFILWLLHFSIVTLASLDPNNSFYAYGWESQLLETTFLAIFLCTPPHVVVTKKTTTQNNDTQSARFPWRLRLALTEWAWKSSSEPSNIILWLFRWLMFRISLGAGLIKIRGNSCWADKTCLYYHFETQPIPSPLSFLYHFLPRAVQTHMVNVDLLVQLYTSWFVLVLVIVRPRPTLSLQSRRHHVAHMVAWTCLWIRRVGGVLQTGLMVGILFSGNFAILNHLTIVPALACLDDACWPTWLRIRRPPTLPPSPLHAHHRRWLGLSLRGVIDTALLLWIMFLSWPVVNNLLQLDGGRQVMNTSYDPFRLVNTYGAFGDVGRQRFEAIVKISDAANNNSNITWKELDFPCKPGNVTRVPCFAAPYHHRADWNIWFLGFPPHTPMLHQRESWVFALLKKLLEVTPSSSINGYEKEFPTNTTLISNMADKAKQRREIIRQRPWLNLLDGETAEHLIASYYAKGLAPRYAKVDMYHYRMAAPLWTLAGDCLRRSRGASSSASPMVWWKRSFSSSLIPPVKLSGSGQLQRA